MHVERTFRVARPVAEVFAYLSDFTRTEEWDPGTVTTRRTSGDGGIGTTYANTSTFAGRTVELTYTTVELVPEQHVVFRGTNEKSTATDDLRMRGVGPEETEIRYRATFVFHGWLKLVAPLVVRRRLDPLADETVAQLKDALER